MLLIRKNSRNNNGAIEFKKSVIDDYLENIPASEWNERMDSFINYYRDNYPGNQYETHKKDKDPNYRWNWGRILERMDFKRY